MSTDLQGTNEAGHRVEHVRLALAQPMSQPVERDLAENLRVAEQLARRAAADGAEILLFPETFPGIWREPIVKTPESELSRIAADAGIVIVGGYAEPVDETSSRCYNTLGVFDTDGSLLGRYRRTTPDLGNWIYKDGEFWDFSWERASELPLISTPFGPIGLLVCSEVFVPELSRIYAARGAEIILLPAGVAGPQSRLYHAWRVLTEARAIENLAYTAVCSNLVRPGDEGIALVAGPEGILLDEKGEGPFVCDLDLSRLRWLREESDRLAPEGKPWASKPGLLRDWRPADVLGGSADVWAGPRQTI